MINNQQQKPFYSSNEKIVSRSVIWNFVFLLHGFGLVADKPNVIVKLYDKLSHLHNAW